MAPLLCLGRESDLLRGQSPPSECPEARAVSPSSPAPTPAGRQTEPTPLTTLSVEIEKIDKWSS